MSDLQLFVPFRGPFLSGLAFSVDHTHYFKYRPRYASSAGGLLVVPRTADFLVAVVVNRSFIKLFRTNSYKVVKECQCRRRAEMSRCLIKRKADKFLLKHS